MHPVCEQPNGRRTTTVVSRAVFFALTAVCLAAATTMGAGEAPPMTSPKLSYRDIQVTVRARRALSEDKVLGPLNLGVRVQEGVAVLWGPVPSADLKQKARDAVKQIKGVFQVHDDDVYVKSPPPAEALAPRLPDPPVESESRLPNLDSPAPGALTGRPGAEVIPAGPSVGGVTLGTPVAVGARPPARVPAPATTTSAAPPADDLASAIERVRLGQTRFHLIQSRLDGDTVTLRAGGARGEDVMAFYRALAHLPGLGRIVIDNDAVQTPR
jgi:hypothetical protein